jgi:hypothetical protein
VISVKPKKGYRDSKQSQTFNEIHENIQNIMKNSNNPKGLSRSYLKNKARVTFPTLRKHLKVFNEQKQKVIAEKNGQLFWVPNLLKMAELETNRTLKGDLETLCQKYENLGISIEDLFWIRRLIDLIKTGEADLVLLEKPEYYRQNEA